MLSMLPGCVPRTEGPLEKRDIIEKWSPQDWREFDRWIKANAIIGSLLAAGLFAMAVAGAPSAGPGDTAAAGNSSGTEITTASSRAIMPER